MWLNTKRFLQLFANKRMPLKKAAYVPPACKTGSAEDVGLDLMKVICSKYSSSVKCGEIINSGREANVFEIEGWKNSYVAKVKKGSSFSTKFIKKRKGNSFDHVFAENFTGSVSIQHRINGEPLYEKHWYNRTMQRQIASVETFKQTFKELNELPDETFADYIKKIIEIRDGNYDIDTINPNNFLLDKVNKKINIVDIEHFSAGADFIKIGDFFPLMNHTKLTEIMAQMTPAECSVLQKQVRCFIDRMIRIAREQGIFLEMHPLEQGKRHKDIVYIYHNAQEELRTIIDGIKVKYNLP